MPDVADVAVIIPAFNSAAHIDQALASVAGQTVPPSTVVVADDCSTDDTVERARRWQGRLPLEVIPLDQNQGPGIARDRAIKATRAALLAMLDADDLFLPDHLETMVSMHTAHPGLVSAQELWWYPGLDLKVRTSPRGIVKASYELDRLLRDNFVNFGFFSRDLYETVGGFRFSKQPGEDWDLWIRMVRAGASLTMAAHPTAIHRMRPGSLTWDPARTAEGAVVVLSAALQAARTPREAAATRAELRTLKSKVCFYRAIELVAQGRLRQARRVALTALPAGGPRSTVGLLALAAAPATAAKLERLTRAYRLPMEPGFRQTKSLLPPGLSPVIAPGTALE